MSNVGFGEDATHTTGNRFDKSVDGGIDTNQIPTFLLRDAAADLFTFDHIFGGKWKRFPFSLLQLPRRAAAATFRSLKAAIE